MLHFKRYFRGDAAGGTLAHSLMALRLFDEAMDQA
jgi:hypothetical protein